ncbi:PqqD family peptide modification chaperone [Kitasatospora sp. NPDC087315]|uniref:PqqD family peptide modification chaperone n=1 Tax=Kitasatospora sp. NPDC087315 TaxID=3364069 RepID=UPI00380696E4
MTPRVVPHVTLVRESEAAVLLDKKSGKYFRLNRLGADVFDLLSAGQSPEEITETLRKRFPEARERIPDDVLRLVEQLRAARIVVDR